MRSPRFSPPVSALLAACAALSASSAASAQTAPQLALDRFEPSFAGDRMFGVPSPFSAGHTTVHAALIADYAHDPLVLRRESDGQSVGSIVGSQLFLHFNATLSLWDRVSLNLDMPVAVHQTGDSPSGGDLSFVSPSSAAAGDLRAGLRVRLYGEYHDAFQLALGGYLWAPTGAVKSYVSDGSIRGLPQLIAGGRALDRVLWSCAVGPELRAAQDFAGLRTGPALRWGAGLGFLLGEKRELQLSLETSGALLLRDVATRAFNGEVLGTSRFRVADDVEVGFGVGPGLSNGAGTPDFRAVGMIAYTPEQKRDRDKDGIPDDLDACPDQPGIKSADPKKHGCPPPKDRDKDGIPDDLDACPDEAGISSTDPKQHGCPPPPDRDKDGIADALDACPDEAGPATSDPKTNGCPPDRDKDGIPDAKDACPDIKGVADPDPKKHGCPPDTDGDGFRDDVDACPNEKGVDSPDPAKRGCPVSVRVTENEVLILQQVQFDTAKATIKKVSDPLLDEVAGVFKDHPEILRIEVQGHTDDRGARAINVRLSQERADAVRKALMARGIEAGRLSAKGYGPDQPVADNKTEEGRQKNRRVQFKIVEKAARKAK